MISKTKKLIAATAIAAAILATDYAQGNASYFAPREKSKYVDVSDYDRLKKDYFPITNIPGASLGFFALPASWGVQTPAASGLIQSIQNFTTQIASGNSSATQAISSVTTANTMLVYGGNRSSDASNLDADTNDIGLTLTNTTTVTVQTGATTTTTPNVAYTVLEWKSRAISRIQSGTIALGSGVTSNTATITSVTSTNALCHFNGMTYGGATSNTNHAICTGKVILTNGTTVTATRNTSSTVTLTVYYVVVEFASGILQSNTQHITVDSGGNATGTTTITSVTTSRTALFWGGTTTTASTGSNRDWARIDLTNSTIVTVTRDSAGTTVATCSVVEFKTADIQSVNRGTIALASGTVTNTATITAVVTTKSFASFLGLNTNGTGTAYDRSHCTTVLTNTTTVTATRLNSTADVTNSYEVIEFKA